MRCMYVVCVLYVCICVYMLVSTHISSTVPNILRKLMLFAEFCDVFDENDAIPLHISVLTLVYVYVYVFLFPIKRFDTKLFSIGERYENDEGDEMRMRRMVPPFSRKMEYPVRPGITVLLLVLKALNRFIVTTRRIIGVHYIPFV